MKIKIDTSGVDALKLRLAGLSKKVEVATVSALNDAAFIGSKKTSEEIARVFDRPTPWVTGSVRYKKARSDKLESSIDLDKWGNKYGVSVDQVLAAQTKGGQRRHKRHEVALQRAGILPAGMWIVPGSGVDLDRYGNISGALTTQIIAWFKAFGEQGYNANINDKGRARLAKGNKKTGAYGFAYFALQKPHGKLQPGIYKRFKTGFGYAIKPVMIFVQAPNYKKRLDFYGVADRASRAEFDRSFKRYLAQFVKERGL